MEPEGAVMPEPQERMARRLPSVDRVLNTPQGDVARARYGHGATVEVVRAVLAVLRAQPEGSPDVDAALVASQALQQLEAAMRPRQRRVFNLTGTVLHTNLGRALLSEAAIEAAVAAMRYPTNLEYDLVAGRRGERDEHVRDLVCALTGAEDVVLVNNNAAAVLLVANTFAKGREAIVSRGELIEIGGAFRLPDVIARAGARLREVGTTNRTHLSDYEEAMSPRTGLLMKVHTSNYVIEGFTAQVEAAALARLGRVSGVPLLNDLGSGTLVDLARFNLAQEPTVQQALKQGADIVTFSGDKLLGGPQAGIIVGRTDLLQRVARNPLKRALRLDKIRLAALEATLGHYRNPDLLPTAVPILRQFTRSIEELRILSERVLSAARTLLAPIGEVALRNCVSEIGSGSLPGQGLASVALAIRPRPLRSGRAVQALAATFRALPVPCIGRIEKGELLFDLRGLDDEPLFLDQLSHVDRIESQTT
jgi:L-seryl-tRNA(Ser) seleniumtransferase